MIEAKCKNCEAIFIIDEYIPENMECFCNSIEFELVEKKILLA